MSTLFSSEAVTFAALWTIAWQSSLWLAAGLMLSRIWRQRPARAHLALVVCLVAALVSPLLTLAAGAMQLGMLAPREVAVIPPAAEAPTKVQAPDGARVGSQLAARDVLEEPSTSQPDSSRAMVVPSPHVETIEAAAEPQLTLPALLFVFLLMWCIVSLGLLARLVLNLIGAVLVVRNASPLPDEALHAHLARAANRFQVAPPRLVRSPICRCPMIWCWSRPVLFVPQDATAETPLAWEAIFSHELAHLLRRDHLADLCGELAVALLPWNPLAWLARSRMHALAEEACDDWAVATGGDALDYAESLLALVPQQRTAALAAVTIRSPLGARVKRLLAERLILPTVGWRFGAALFAGALLVACGAALAQRSERVAHAVSPSGSEPTTASLDSSNRVELRGAVFDQQGQPLNGADVAVICRKRMRQRGGELGASMRDGSSVVVAQTTSRRDGSFSLRFVAPQSDEVENTAVVARAAGKGLMWAMYRPELHADELRFDLPAEQPIKGRLIDIDGQALSGIRLNILGYSETIKQPEMFPKRGVGFSGLALPSAWPAEVVSDVEGHVAILGVGPGHGVLVEVAPTDRIAPQQLSLNTGQSETRLENDGTYRASVVKNLKPGEEGVFVLAPAQPVSGIVTYEDTGEPVDRGRVTVYASDRRFGSAVGIGSPVTAGRYAAFPYPGVNFRVTAYPPEDSPYLIRDRKFDWESHEKSAKIDIKLPRGVLIHGRVINDETKAAIVGARIVYERQGSRDGFEDVITSWQGAQLTDNEGRFSMAVLPGPGHLLVSSPDGKFVLQEIGSRTLAMDKPGGQRTYAHAIQKVDYPVQDRPVELTIALKPSPEVVGSVVDSQGKPVETAKVITRLTSAPDTTWRGFRAGTTPGGRFSLAGWNGDETTSVSFWEPKRKIGATVQFGARDVGRDLRIELLPAGSATMRFVDPRGKAVSDYQPTLYMLVTPGPPRFPADKAQEDQLAADADFVANVDRENHSAYLKSDEEGRLQFDALIPGATYQILTYVEGEAVIMKEFVVEPTRTLDLGEIIVPDQKNN